MSAKNDNFSPATAAPRIVTWPDGADAQRAVAAELAAAMRAGALVALPTETVYGLAAPGLDTPSVQRIFHAKGRPSHNPVILHVASADEARALTTSWPDAAQRLADALWPGPLTLVLPRSSAVPDIVTAGGPTVAVRVPAHPAFLAVLHALGEPIAAPSANRSNHISPTTAAHVARSLGARVDIILDAGPVFAGIESTVVDLTTQPARLLRPGPIALETLRDILGESDVERATIPEDASEVDSSADIPPLRAPGMLRRHYAPDAPATLVTGPRLAARLRDTLAATADHIVLMTCTHNAESAAGLIENIEHRDAQRVIALTLPTTPDEYAQQLYAALHRADELGAAAIIIEAPPEAPAWCAVADRLRRATSQRD